MDTTGFTNAAKLLAKELEELEVIPPKNGKRYNTHSKTLYAIAENESVAVNEMQFNLASLLAEDPELPYWKAYVLAGYKWEGYLKEAKAVKRAKAHLTAAANQKMNPEVTKLMHFLRDGPAEQLLIDKVWVLNESVKLYDISKREKNLTVAARLLDQIAQHVDVDAKASNKVEVTEKVDYASILQEADSRLLEATPLPLEQKEAGGGIVDAEIIYGSEEVEIADGSTYSTNRDDSKVL